MKYQEYLTEIQEIQSCLLDFLDDESNDEEKFQDLIKSLDSHKIQEKKEELKLFLNLLAIINAYHHRVASFYIKIEQIIQFCKIKIKENFSNIEIFNIFKLNKRIILYLLNEKIISIDESIFTAMNDYKNRKYHFIEYFQPEIKSFIQENNLKDIPEQTKENIMKELPSDFIENRNKGENENYICQLIRDDEVIEFIAYVNKNNYPLNSIIESSIYETHAFLLRECQSSLIEYAAFFGSIQIFQYLKMNNVELTNSLWYYVIHSRNAELLHILEENHIKPRNESYHLCLRESIRCHHNDFANYIKNNLLTDENKYKNSCNIIMRRNALSRFTPEAIEAYKKEINHQMSTCLFYVRNEASFGFHFYNFEFLPLNNDQIDLSEFPDPKKYKNINFIFFYACQYGYFSIVKILLETEKIDIYETIIFF